MQYSVAQKIGAKAGLNISSVNTDLSIGTFSNNIGYNASIFVEKNLIPMLSVRPELGYSQLGYKYELLTVQSTNYLNYLQFSLDLRLKPPIIPLYVVAGPYASYMLSGSSKIGSTSSAYDFGTGKILRLDYGLNGGIGYVQNLALIKLFVEFRYEMGMADFDDYTDNYFIKNRNISITVGFML